jgi:hypothetical protein
MYIYLSSAGEIPLSLLIPEIGEEIKSCRPATHALFLCQEINIISLRKSATCGQIWRYAWGSLFCTGHPKITIIKIHGPAAHGLLGCETIK